MLIGTISNATKKDPVDTIFLEKSKRIFSLKLRWGSAQESDEGMS